MTRAEAIALHEESRKLQDETNNVLDDMFCDFITHEKADEIVERNSKRLHEIMKKFEEAAKGDEGEAAE